MNLTSFFLQIQDNKQSVCIICRRNQPYLFHNYFFNKPQKSYISDIQSFYTTAILFLVFFDIAYIEPTYNHKLA